jgi:hypothetical protein
MSELEPYPVGTVVTYHGSQSDGTDRRYVVTKHRNPKEVANTWFPQIPVFLLDDAYPDGVAYDILPDDVPNKFGNRDHMVHRVRRESITPVDFGEASPQP